VILTINILYLTDRFLLTVHITKITEP